MPSLPSQLALTTIADGANAVAADHRNNFNAIQTAANATTTALSGGVAGQVLTATSSSAVAWASVGQGAKAVISSTVAITNGTLTTVTFDAADTWDTDAFHDPVTNNSRMTVPAGLTGKYMLSVNLILSLAASNPGGQFRLNGSTSVGCVGGIGTFSGGAGVICGSQTVSLSAGDYVEFQAWLQTGSVSVNSGFFTIQKVG